MSRNIQPQSSQLAEPLWTDPGIKSGICVCEVISTLKKNKKKQAQVRKEMVILPESSQERKKPLSIVGEVGTETVQKSKNERGALKIQNHSWVRGR